MEKSVTQESKAVNVLKTETEKPENISPPGFDDVSLLAAALASGVIPKIASEKFYGALSMAGNFAVESSLTNAAKIKTGPLSANALRRPADEFESILQLVSTPLEALDYNPVVASSAGVTGSLWRGEGEELSYLTPSVLTPD